MSAAQVPDMEGYVCMCVCVKGGRRDGAGDRCDHIRLCLLFCGHVQW